MKKYNVFKLSVVKINMKECDRYFICENIPVNKDYVKEVFTGQKFKIEDITMIDPLSEYHSILSIYNPEIPESSMLTLKDLLNEYIEINLYYFSLENEYRKSNEIFTENELNSGLCLKGRSFFLDKKN